MKRLQTGKITKCGMDLIAQTLQHGFYNFGLGIFFTPSIYLQAGLIAVDDGRSPNMQRSAGNFQNGMAPENYYVVMAA